MVKRSPIHKRSSKDFWDDQHRLLADMSESWKHKAGSLKRAADILWETCKRDFEKEKTLEVGDAFQPSVRPITMMLYGLCIENLIKSVLASKSGMLDEKGKLKHKTHRLLELFEKAEVDLDDDESGLVERLEQFIIWVGRYPIPLNAGDRRPRTLNSGGFAPLELMYPGDKKTIDRLIDRLINLKT